MSRAAADLESRNDIRSIVPQVTMLQIAVPSRTDVREYQDLKLEMDQLIGCINGRFTTPNWSPIRYIYGCVSQDELAAFYRDAAVALVTPLRDGMNLVAKEFVACQINTPPGVLIVSPFAGAGEMMHEALICNPYEIDEAAEVIHRYAAGLSIVNRVGFAHASITTDRTVESSISRHTPLSNLNCSKSYTW